MELIDLLQIHGTAKLILQKYSELLIQFSVLDALILLVFFAVSMRTVNLDIEYCLYFVRLAQVKFVSALKMNSFGQTSLFVVVSRVGEIPRSQHNDTVACKIVVM